MSILPLEVTAQLPSPFYLIAMKEAAPEAGSEAAGTPGGKALSKPLSELNFMLGIGQTKQLLVEFDPCYRPDCHTRVATEKLVLIYTGHPHVVYILSKIL